MKAIDNGVPSEGYDDEAVWRQLSEVSQTGICWNKCHEDDKKKLHTNVDENREMYGFVSLTNFLKSVFMITE